MNRTIIEDFVFEKLQKEPTGHDYLHALRVVQNASNLVDDSMDHDVIFATCLVHDLMDEKLDEIYLETKDNIKKVLQQALLTELQIKHVFSIIETMSFRTGKTPDTIEGKVVQDADRLDALGAIGIARAFSYGGANKRLLYDPLSTNSNDTVSHFYQKLFLLSDRMNTNKAKEQAVKRTEFMKLFIDQLYNEVKQ